MSQTIFYLCQKLSKKFPGGLLGLILLGGAALLSFFLTRVAIALLSGGEWERSLPLLLLTFAVGALSDLVAAGWMFAPLALLLALVPRRWTKGRRLLCLGALALHFFLLLFLATAELLFWDEFHSRLNFIAVDYLAYTTEVTANIWQSYPVGKVLLAILLLALGAAWLCQRYSLLYRRWEVAQDSCRKGLIALGIYLFALGALTLLAPPGDLTRLFRGNHIQAEAASNGLLSLARAFYHNSLKYEQFYLTMPRQENSQALREELAADGGEFLSGQCLDIRRALASPREEKRWNVVLILEESLSAAFTGCLGGKPDKTFTPNLDALAQEGMLWTRCFASGTRTVRGLEAIQLSIPPTPGQSLVKRPHPEGYFSLGHLFRQKGYANTFLYGGDSRFDGMKAFFQGNGYEVQDARSPLSQPKTFSNAWGACDQDLLQWALDDADRRHSQGTPFHQFILTTSNHRPYTFPQGVLDAPQFRRFAAVEYSDFALGEYFRKAREKPWFANTLFILLADHCHSTSGRAALPLDKYHIPVLFYNPLLLPPSRIQAVCSQIDLAPTLFSLMDWDYESSFLGMDVRRLPPNGGRAFPGTFQHLGFLDGATGKLITLYPGRRAEVSQWDLSVPFVQVQEARPAEKGDALLRRAILFYQGTSLRHQMLLDRWGTFASPGEESGK